MLRRMRSNCKGYLPAPLGGARYRCNPPQEAAASQADGVLRPPAAQPDPDGSLRRRAPLGPRLSKLGHHVELPPHKVKESASGNKDDARDARAIWVTGTHKDVRRVPVKTVEQQAELFTHRVRTHWVCMRTATVNLLRSMLYEYGVVAPKGRKKVLGWVGEHRAQIELQVPPMVLQLMDQQLQALRELDERIVANERTLQQTQRADASVANR